MTLDEILNEAKAAIKEANDLRTLDECRIKYLGKKGELTEILKTLGKLPTAERPILGQKINVAKETLQALISERENLLQESIIQQQLENESLDITLPGRAQSIGSLHPVTKTIAELKQIFKQLGFIFKEGPEIENDEYNFTALNIPPLHPARAMQDTFYFEDGLLLRTHMSPVQIRTMQAIKPPLYMAAMGRTYRPDFDLTHTPMFHQMECLVVDENISMAHLKKILGEFLAAFFYKDIAIRFRPSYFPFTEPSAEVDIECLKCHGSGCRICKNSGWLEILGCGMVHPNVLNHVGIDSEQFSGFAWGLGIDRLAMLKYEISDLRSLFENDLRFLSQF